MNRETSRKYRVGPGSLVSRTRFVYSSTNSQEEFLGILMRDGVCVYVSKHKLSCCLGVTADKRWGQAHRGDGDETAGRRS